jgi:hypothetical protein
VGPFDIFSAYGSKKLVEHPEALYFCRQIEYVSSEGQHFAGQHP